MQMVLTNSNFSASPASTTITRALTSCEQRSNVQDSALKRRRMEAMTQANREATRGIFNFLNLFEREKVNQLSRTHPESTHEKLSVARAYQDLRIKNAQNAATVAQRLANLGKS